MTIAHALLIVATKPEDAYTLPEYAKITTSAPSTLAIRHQGALLNR